METTTTRDELAALVEALRPYWLELSRLRLDQAELHNRVVEEIDRRQAPLRVALASAEQKRKDLLAAVGSTDSLRRENLWRLRVGVLVVPWTLSWATIGITKGGVIARNFLEFGSGVASTTTLIALATAVGGHFSWPAVRKVARLFEPRYLVRQLLRGDALEPERTRTWAEVDAEIKHVAARLDAVTDEVRSEQQSATPRFTEMESRFRNRHKALLRDAAERFGDDPDAILGPEPDDPSSQLLWRKGLESLVRMRWHEASIELHRGDDAAIIREMSNHHGPALWAMEEVFAAQFQLLGADAQGQAIESDALSAFSVGDGGRLRLRMRSSGLPEMELAYGPE